MSALERSMVISSDLREARQAENAVMELVDRHGYDKGAAFGIKLALEEGLNNALRHGNRFDPKKSVQLSFDIDEKRVILIISDEGDGFDPDIVPDPTADENLEKPSGRGIMLMRAYMDEVHFSETGNQVRMVKRND